MTDRELAAYESFVRVVRCVHRHPALLEAAQHSNALALLEEVIAGMEGAEQTKLVSDSTSEELATQLEHASTLLKLLLSALVNAAVLAGIQPRTSGKVFREPTVDDTPRARIAMARAAADRAVEHEAALQQAGLPPTFIAELRSAAGVVESLLGGRIDAKAAKTNAGDTVPTLIKRGRTFVGLLEAQLRPQFTGGMAAEFAEAKALGRVHRPKAADAIAPAVSDATTPEASVVRQLEAGANAPGQKAFPLWSTITEFFTRFTRAKAAEPIVDADFTIEEVKRLPAPDETTR